MAGKQKHYKEFTGSYVSNLDLHDTSTIVSKIPKPNYIVTDKINDSQHYIFDLKNFCVEANLSYDSMRSIIRGKSKQLHRGFTVELY